MTKHAAQHDIFVIERVFNAPPALVFHAWADKTAKSKWFKGGSQWTEQIREQDFRVGGRDQLTGKWKDGHTSNFKSQYFDIIPNERIVYVYEMSLASKKISISLATIEFRAEGNGTKLVLTEQGTFIDGYEDGGSRKRGTLEQMDMLEASLRLP